MNNSPRTINFYDTNALLHGLEEIISNGFFFISSTTLEELEHIKTSGNKSEEIKFQARKVTRFLKENEDMYACVVYDKNCEKALDDARLDYSNDNKICICAYITTTTFKERNNQEVVFVTDDLACRVIAKNIFGLKVIGLKDKTNEDEYKGYIEVTMNDFELSEWYSNKTNNWDLINNQYMLVKNVNEDYIDHYRYINGEFEPIKAKDLRSSFLGKFKPLDKQQLIAVDSLSNNVITMIKGKAGTGKSLIAMSYLFSQLEKGKIDKVIVFCNTVATRGAAKLGYYPGSKDEKLLDSQIGNFLSSKLGDKLAVQMLIQQGKLMLLPISDIRGFDTSHMNAGIYITEAQNMSIDLMKLALQRIGDDCICIIDGDYNTQVDDISFSGDNNGMRRMSQIFRGQDFYGEVELTKIHRSRIAEIAENM